jgi:hypothetical protein
MPSLFSYRKTVRWTALCSCLVRGNDVKSPCFISRDLS